jgi:hypothetical protein
MLDGTIVVEPRFPHLDLHGPHDLRHTLATWLEEAGIPSRVIDELMGHVGTKQERASESSPMGRVYRETTPGWSPGSLPYRDPTPT